MGKLDERSLMQGTIDDLESCLATLRAELAAIMDRISDTEARRDAWKSRLKQLGSDPGKERLRKGAALDAINAVFSSTMPGSGLTISEISKASGTAWSSIRNAITKENSGYYEKLGRFYPARETRTDKTNGVQEQKDVAKK